MMGITNWVVIGAVLLCAGILFAVAWAGDRAATTQLYQRARPAIYSLTLAIYCTSWTFFGAVGTAALQGWSYLPIYLGPILIYLFGQPLLRRIAATSKQENINSIAEFLSSRYGKSRSVGALATLLAVLGGVPYIALQLRAISMSYVALTQGSLAPSPDKNMELAFGAMLALAAFTILFGARKTDAARPQDGLSLAIAAESVLKLCALLAVGLLATFICFDIWPDVQTQPALFENLQVLDAQFIPITLLAMAAALCLPRQFQVGVVQYRDARDLKASRWIFPVYLILVSLLVLPITLAGKAVLPGETHPDLFVLALPLFVGAKEIALLAFIGGLSAATAMVIVETVALATMVSNHVVMPLLLSWRTKRNKNTEMYAQVLLVRRVMILSILSMGFVYFWGAQSSANLAQIGLISFAAAAQFIPSLMGALYWRRGHRDGALGGLSVGLLAWAYTLALPAILGPGHSMMLALQSTSGGLFDPQALLGMTGLSPLTHGMITSLGLNAAAYFMLSLRAFPRLVDRVQVGAFVDRHDVGEYPKKSFQTTARIADIKALLDRFLGPQESQAALDDMAREHDLVLNPQAPADLQIARGAERILAGVLGSGSARLVIATALSDAEFSIEHVALLLDETSSELKFRRELLNSALTNMSQGMSVIDQNLRLVAWNPAYLELFDYPEQMISAGTPVADLIQWNAERGMCGPGDPHTHVEKRLAALRSGKTHMFERIRADGRIVRMIGQPFTGGYVMTFTDITEDKQKERALMDANIRLEERVAERTRALSKLAEDLDAARQSAEQANAEKTRFLAAASHDLLQPLNAARLYAGALASGLSTVNPHFLATVTKIDRSIASADDLLRRLLDISKLDQGGIQPKPELFAIQSLLDDLAIEFASVAQRNGLELRIINTRRLMVTDRVLLQSALQNLISNAMRYTKHGKILLGCKARGASLGFMVVDRGPGIPDDKQVAIFDEFFRLTDVDTQGERGAGLGLAIVARISRLLDGEVHLRSHLGRGSCFELRLPVQDAQQVAPSAQSILGAQNSTLAFTQAVLTIDDDPEVRTAMRSILESWGAVVYEAATVSDARDLITDQVLGLNAIFADYDLGESETGLDVLLWARGILSADVRICLITASQEPAVFQAAQAADVAVLKKPIAPNELRAILAAD
jgi:Na+/proline symporter/signal transduction histidine kinase